nr:hypothetical protein [White spot syndrome virus]WUY11397.1 hypothetical protein [White spot syndrome virus]WUY11568.1 hypothetical protein [White spot syndrome virus]
MEAPDFIAFIPSFNMEGVTSIVAAAVPEVAILITDLMGGRNNKRSTYERIVGIVGESGDLLEAILDICNRNSYRDELLEGETVVINPTGLLKEISLLMKKALDMNIKMKSNDDPVPFTTLDQNEQEFIGHLKSCKKQDGPAYKDLIHRIYSGMFVMKNTRLMLDEIIRGNAGDAVEEKNALCEAYAEMISDMDLIRIFLLLVAIKRDQNKKHRHMKSVIYEDVVVSLNTLKDVFHKEWYMWPFSALQVGTKIRDARTFSVLFGSDMHEGRNNDRIWENMAFSVTEAFLSGPSTNNHYNKGHLRMYAARPVYDAMEYVPQELHHILFGTKIAKMIDIVYRYSIYNVPYLLAADTERVEEPKKSVMSPSGLIISPNASLLENTPLSLVSRHGIPSARKLGSFILEHENAENMHLEEAIAKCMVSQTLQEESWGESQAAMVYQPSDEVEVIQAHVTKILSGNTTNKTCGLCYADLDMKPKFFNCSHENMKASYDYFPVHAFMDTFEARQETCSAKLCPDCTIKHLMYVYEKVSAGSEKLKDVFRCPCCGEYMVQFIGRCHEFSSLFERAILAGENVDPEYIAANKLLITELIKRAEKCFYTVELLQAEFMEMCKMDKDFALDKDSKFTVVDNRFRPPVKLFKMVEGETGDSKCSLICTQCLLPNVCDQPNEMEDIVTVDVPPPVLPYPPPEQLEDYYFQDVEDAEFDDPPTDELVRYDTGPGLHKWPMRLSCGFLASNFVPPNEEVTNCRQAVSILKRTPEKKIRGWNPESPEGKVLLALANWHLTDRMPENMKGLLNNISVIHNTRERFQNRVKVHYLNSVFGGFDDRDFEQVVGVSIPLIATYFYVYEKLNHESALGLWAKMFVKNLIGEMVLERPECVFHRAHSFVLHCVDRRALSGIRPNQGAKMEIVKQVNIVRQNMTSESIKDPVFTVDEKRTLEWKVEKEGQEIKTVKCPKCKTPNIKLGGCITMTCYDCSGRRDGYPTVFCWICEDEITNPDHILIDHKLLYSDCKSTKAALEKVYNCTLCCLALRKCSDSYLSKQRGGGEEEEIEIYVMEDGFEFDVHTKTAVPTK